MISKSEQGALRHRFSAIKGSGVPVSWASAAEFAAWSRQNGYQYGMQLIRIDESGDWCPENCRWADVPPSFENQITKSILAKQWDDFVAPIRKRLAEEAKRLPPEPEFFRYEHPDLEREGITWGTA